MQGGRDHKLLWNYLRQRYPYVFKDEPAGAKKSRPLFKEIWIKQYIDDINMLHRAVCKGDLKQIKELEAMNADEYYSTINIFLKEIERAEAEQDKKVKS